MIFVILIYLLGWQEKLIKNANLNSSPCSGLLYHIHLSALFDLFDAFRRSSQVTGLDGLPYGYIGACSCSRHLVMI